MTAWRPLEREPDPLRAALYDYLRSRAARIFLEENANPSLGRAVTTMSNGRALTIELTMMPAEAVQFANRAAIGYHVAGYAAEASAGYEIQGRVVIDRQTLAFLMIEAVPQVLERRRPGNY
jgi:hypothetical protein